MLRLTPAATDHLVDVLHRNDADDGTGVRFIADDRGWSMRLDSEAPGDRVIEHEGRTLVLVGEGEAQALGGLTLDVEESDDNARFVLRAPDG